MDLLNTAAIFRYHKEQIRIHGHDAVEALGWDDKEGQLARFRELVQIGDLNHHSVLDAGCGHGDLRAFLGEHYPHLRYFGVEQMPDLLEVATQKYAHLPETLFFQGDFVHSELPVTDYIIACGSLSYRNSDPLFVPRTIEKLFNNCRLAFGFNLLSEAYPPDGLLVAYPPEFIVEYCRQLTRKLRFINGYRSNDYTIFMYH